MLNTLSAFLSPKGGIKSGNEVVRLLHLMKKNSKQLVAKSIYIEILRATTPTLLEMFLNEKGWDLLHLWFSGSIETQNWPLCLDIITLYEICPITAETLEVNQVTKLISQLRMNPKADKNVCESANILCEKWVATVSPKLTEPTVVTTAPASVTNVKSGVETGTSEDGSITMPQILAEEVEGSLNNEDQKDKGKKLFTRKQRKSKEAKKKKEKILKEKEKEGKKEKKQKRQQLRSNHLAERHRKRLRLNCGNEVDPLENRHIKENKAEAREEKETLKKIGPTAQTSTFTCIPKIPKKAVMTSPDHSKNKDAKRLSFNQRAQTDETSSSDKVKTAVLLDNFSSKTKSRLDGSFSFKHHHSHHHSSSPLPSSSKKEDKRDKERESLENKSSSPSSLSKHTDFDQYQSSCLSPGPAKLRLPSKRTSIDSGSSKRDRGKNTLSESTGFIESILHSMRGDEPKRKRQKLSEMGNKLAESPGHKKSSTPEKKRDANR